MEAIATTKNRKTDLRSQTQLFSTRNTTKMSHYEPNVFEEELDYKRYYSAPLEVGGILFGSLADFDTFLRLKENEAVRLQKMTIDLRALIQRMANEQKIERMYAEMFPNAD